MTPRATSARSKIYLDRIIGSTGERVAWPQASLERPRFLSDFAAIEVANYSQSLLAVTPYVSGLYDNVGSNSDGDAGVDMFWKPNGQMQLTATVNPDFGQVESDDLVVNFSATETFISDKRPFFTENQGIFEFTTPSDFSQLLYTRRVGGPADDGEGSGDITAALKLNGSIGATKYGVFAADEAESVGRTFGALRVVRDFEQAEPGTHGDAMSIARTSIARPPCSASITTGGPTRAGTSARACSAATSSRRAIEHDATRGATVWADYEMDHGWRQQWIAMHFGNDLQINDAGYLSRNSTNYLHWQVNRRFTDMPEASRYSSKDWRWRVSTDYNDHGQLLNHQFRMSRESRLRNGSYEYGQININSAGYDDLLTRGNGVLWLPPNFNSYFDYQRPRKGNWAYEVEVNAYQRRPRGQQQGGLHRECRADLLHQRCVQRLRRPVCATARRTGWSGSSDNLIGSFDEHRDGLRRGLNWTIGSKQELRVKLQAIGLEARTAAGVPRRCRRQRRAERRAGRRHQRAQPRLPDPLSLRARAAVLSIRGVRPRRLSTRSRPPTEHGQPAARQLPAARRRAAAGEVQLPVRELNACRTGCRQA